MNSQAVAVALRRDTSSKRIFRGVYPRDRLPLHVDGLEQPCAFIINTDGAAGAGKHWVAVWFDGYGRAAYFDSFGLPPIHPDIKHFILRHSHSYRFNPMLIQDVLSSACGLYVIYFIMQKSRGFSLKRLASIFHPFNLKRNDWTVLRHVRHLL